CLLCSAVLLLFQRRAQGVGDLVRAGGGLAAAGDALHTGNGILGLLTPQQRADALQVAVAAAHDLHGMDGAVVVELYGGAAAADAAIHLGIGSHGFSLLFIFAPCGTGPAPRSAGWYLPKWCRCPWGAGYPRTGHGNRYRR